MFQSPQVEFQSSSLTSGVSLAHTISALTYALDLTEGHQPGHCIRACWIATRLAQAIGLKADMLRDVYYAALVKDLGGSANASQVAQLFLGNDIKLKQDFSLIGPEPEDFNQFIMTRVGVGASDHLRESAVADLLANADSVMTEIIEKRSSRGAEISRQLRLSDDVAQAITHLDEHWDGSGFPLGIAGEAIHIGARIALLSQVADIFFIAGGPRAAMVEVMRRSGTWLDPNLCDSFQRLASSPIFWTALGAKGLDQQIVLLDPAADATVVGEDYLDEIVAAFGQVIDAKSKFNCGLSARVGLYADMIARHIGVNDASRRRICHAAALRDIGNLGVSSAILDKPGPLDEVEWLEIRNHVTITGEILGRVAAFNDMAMVAAAHHERLDGAGYPMKIDNMMISMESRIITVADIFGALTAVRPYRAALSVNDALHIMAAEVGAAIDPHCFYALQMGLASGSAQKSLAHLVSSPAEIAG